MNYNTNDNPCQEVDKARRREKITEMPQEWKQIEESAPSPLIKKVTYHKWRNIKVSAALRSIGEKERANAINECATFVKVARRNGHDIFSYANFCRQRLCSVCGWRRSAKFVTQMIPVINLLAGRGFSFVFLTLTVPNCKDNEVNNTITEILDAWRRLYRKRKYQRLWHGFCRSIEVTYSAKSDTYHPHIHVLLAVGTNYYKSVLMAEKDRKYDYKGNKLMTDFDLSLSDEWRTALKNEEYNNLSYPLQVIIEPANREHNKTIKSVTTSAAVETLKYALKIRQKDIANKTIATLLYSLSSRRLISFGGVIEEMRQRLNQSDIEDELNEDFEENQECREKEVLYIFNPSGWKILEE